MYGSEKRREFDDYSARSTAMPELTIELPGSITQADARLYLAIKLFEIGRVSCGQAADLAGYSKRTFMELLGTHGVPGFDFPAAEIADDLSHA